MKLKKMGLFEFKSVSTCQIAQLGGSVGKMIICFVWNTWLPPIYLMNFSQKIKKKKF